MSLTDQEILSFLQKKSIEKEKIKDLEKLFKDMSHWKFSASHKEIFDQKEMGEKMGNILRDIYKT